MPKSGSDATSLEKRFQCDPCMSFDDVISIEEFITYPIGFGHSLVVNVFWPFALPRRIISINW